jgi:tetratricopeptide (TPR) repeat protein
MTESAGVRAAGLLVDQAWAAYAAGRYREAVAAASRAAAAAGQLDDPVLLVRALDVEASALMLMGDDQAALARYTRILGLAEDPASRGRLDDPQAARAVASAHWNWVGCARFVTGIPVRELFGVLDAAERWLAATGHLDWRASILSERADVHRRLGEHDAAVAAAEEALAIGLRHPAAPGFTLNGLRFSLGDILGDAGRAAEAEPHYRAVLDDPAAIAWVRYAAHEGLARCALAAGDPAAARREARAAVLLAEPLGDNALCTSLEALAAACRAGGDLDAAWQAATRYLEAAGRIGGHYRPYYAARTAADIALDRGDLDTARQLLAELDEHAKALDTDTATTTWTSETARRHQRLADLATPHPEQT